MRRLPFAILLATSALAMEAGAQTPSPQAPQFQVPPSCQGQLETAWDQVAVQAIDAWSQTKRVIVDDAVRIAMKAQYCTFPISQSSQPPSTDAFKNSLSTTVGDFLDYQSNPDGVSPTFTAMLGQKVNGGGIARPRPKANGRIEVTYSKTVDAVKIRGKDYAPWTVFMVSTGVATFEGFAANSPACSVVVNVPATPAAKITC